MEHQELELEKPVTSLSGIWAGYFEEQEQDFGIDAQLEIVENNEAIGKLIAIQIKSGMSQVQKEDEEGYGTWHKS